MLGCVDWWYVTDLAGRHICPIFKSKFFHSSCLRACPLKMGPVGNPKTLVPDYQSTLRDFPEERRPRSHHKGKPGGETMCHTWRPYTQERPSWRWRQKFHLNYIYSCRRLQDVYSLKDCNSCVIWTHANLTKRQKFYLDLRYPLRELHDVRHQKGVDKKKPTRCHFLYYLFLF